MNSIPSSPRSASEDWKLSFLRERLISIRLRKIIFDLHNHGPLGRCICVDCELVREYQKNDIGEFAPVVDFFNRACDITAVAAAQVRKSNGDDAAAFVRHCLASELSPAAVYGFIPAGRAPSIGAILDAATGMVGMLPPEERTRLTHARLAGITQWAREAVEVVK